MTVKADKIKELFDLAELNNLNIVERHLTKPWGAYLRFENSDTEKFLKAHFPDVKLSPGLELSPKYLLVAPKKRLSWQWHRRREELWRVIQGEVGICLNDGDTEVEPKIYKKGDLVEVPVRTRHRIVGLADWAIVAEIWIHTNPRNPSNELDNVRVQDDFVGFKDDQYR